jgi:GalNAc-alpha-(1->4)-GalNAc-alpha-(1->3)-diNAcBac-PP-undecaprenol alpha-1,4-N-acetyl-D-galactosaminyltransferase
MKVKKRKNKIRVTIVVNDFSIGGMEKQLSLLFPLFNKDKFDFHFITLFEFKDGHTLYQELPKWLPVYRLNFSSSRDVRSWFKLAKILSKIQPDIVMSSLFFSNTAVRIIKPFVGYKVIAREHNTYIDKKRIHIFIDKLLSKFTYKIVAVSKTVAEFTSKQEKIPLDKFSVIHNGVNVEFIKDALSKMPQKEDKKKSLGLKDFDKIALNVARLTPQKNHRLLIKSFYEFSSNHTEYKLLILGAGSLKKELQKLISDLGADKKIFLLDYKDNVLDYCRVSEFFVSTSEIEGLSNAYLEALSCGLPVVATKTAGTDELIEDGINGFFIKDVTINSVISALELIADSDFYKLSENARRKAEEFDISQTVSKYHALFEECYNS